MTESFPLSLAGLLLIAALAAAAEGDAPRPRARDLGIAPGVFPPGPLNAITDVAGVRVGHTTIHQGDEVHTGVTAVVPHGGNLFQEKVAGGVFVGNAFGKLAGSTQVEELGTIETPIVLTNTLAVGTALEAVVADTLARPGNEEVRSVNAVVGETNDAGLNAIRSLPVNREHVLAAIREAREGPVAEGTVGAGTGTQCFGWKGGIGTASRKVEIGGKAYTVGALVQSKLAAADAARVVLGESSGTLVTALAILCVATLANIQIMELTRTNYAMARAGRLPPALATVSKSGTPRLALLTGCVAIAVIILAADSVKGQLYEILLDLYAPFVMIILMSFSFAVIWLRRCEPDLPRPWKMPLYPFPAVLSLVLNIALLLLFLTSDWKTGIWSALLLACAVPLYWLGKVRWHTA